MAKKQSWSEMDKGKIPLSRLRQAYSVFNKTAGKSPHTVVWNDLRLELFERSRGSPA